MTAQTIGTRITGLRATRLSVLDIRLQLGLATLFGIVLRFWDLRGVPPGLNQDEAVYGYDAYSIFMTGRDHLGHPFPFASLETFGDWSSPLLTFLSIPFVALFGLRVEVLRGVSALIGVAAVPLVYYLAVALFRRPALGVVAAWLLALSPWAVHLSRWAIIPTVVPTMVAATLLALVYALQNSSSRGIVLAALLAALTVATYHAMKLYGPLLCIAAGLVYFRQLRRMSLEALAYGTIVFLAIAGPIFWLTARDPGGGARLAQTSVLHDHALTPGLVIGQYASYFSPSFWFSKGDGDPMHLPAGEGLMPLAVAPLLIAGLIWLAITAVKGRDQISRQGARLLLMVVVMYPLPGMMTLPNPHVLRAVHVIPLAAIVGAAGAVWLWDLVYGFVASRRLSAAMPVAGGLALAFAVVLAVELGVRYDTYFTRYPDQVAENFRFGMKDALAYVDTQESNYDQVWVDDNNSSYIYVLFYKRWDPADVHDHLVVVRNAPDWNRAVSIGKYRFGTPPDLVTDSVAYEARYHDGAVAYEVVAGSSDGQRVLVVRHPESD